MKTKNKGLQHKKVLKFVHSLELEHEDEVKLSELEEGSPKERIIRQEECKTPTFKVTLQEFFFKRVNANWIEEVRKLIKNKNLDLNQIMEGGDTALTHATRSGYHEIVELLLSHPRVDPNQPSRHGTPLNLSILHGKLTITELFLKHRLVNINKAKDFVSSPLMLAIKYERIAVIKMLLKHPTVDINEPHGVGNETPVYAICRDNLHELLGLILEHPLLEINKKTPRGVTPLWIACRHQHEKIIKLLVIYKGHELILTEKYVSWYEQCANPTTPLQEAWDDKSNMRAYAALQDFEPSEDPKETMIRQRLVRFKFQREVGLSGEFAADVFSLVVFLCDGYVKLRDAEVVPFAILKFFTIIQRLSMDLQMLICNRCFGIILKDIIPQADLEKAFRKITWKFAIEEKCKNK